MPIAPIGINDVLKKRELWSDFAKMNSGKLKIINTKSGEFTKLQLSFDLHNASILFTETDTKPFRVEIDIPEYKNDIKFLLTTSDSLDKVFSFLVRNKIKTNSSKFNQAYQLKSSNSMIVKTIFNDTKIQQLILEEEIIMISGSRTQNLLHIEMAAGRNINEPEHLNTIFLLSKMILEKV